MSLVIYTDGAVTRAGIGGWAYVVPAKDIEKYGTVPGSTNNTMELQAAIEAMVAFPGEDLTIISDSQYLVNGANSWVYGWAKRGWITSDEKAVANRDQWEAIIRLKEGRVVQFKWVKGHNLNEGNERADQLASAAARPETAAEWATHRRKLTGEQVKAVRQQKCFNSAGERIAVLQMENGDWHTVPLTHFKQAFEKIEHEEAADTASA